MLVERVTHGRSNASGVRKGGLAVNRIVLENILNVPCHANCHVLMSVLPFLHTFSTSRQFDRPLHISCQVSFSALPISVVRRKCELKVVCLTSFSPLFSH